MHFVEYQEFGRLLLYSDVGGFYLELIRLILCIHHRLSFFNVQKHSGNMLFCYIL